MKRRKFLKVLSSGVAAVVAPALVQAKTVTSFSESDVIGAPPSGIGLKDEGLSMDRVCVPNGHPKDLWPGLEDWYESHRYTERLGLSYGGGHLIPAKIEEGGFLSIGVRPPTGEINES